MKQPLIIFGSGDIAQLAHFYFSTDSEYEVVAFTVDAAYRTETTFCDLPVIAFEEILNHYPPEQCEIFVAPGASSGSGAARSCCPSGHQRRELRHADRGTGDSGSRHRRRTAPAPGGAVARQSLGAASGCHRWFSTVCRG